MLSTRGAIDFIAYDREGHIVLLAEAKSRGGTSERWAAGLRKNMLSRGTLPLAKYFLIATPERMYLWKHDRLDPAETPPEFTIDATKVFQPYFQRFHQEPSDIGPEEFDFLVLTWLNDIAKADQDRKQQDVFAPWLSDLSGSLQQARIEMNRIQ